MEVDLLAMIRHFLRTSSRVILRKKMRSRRVKKSQKTRNKFWNSKVVTLIAPSVIKIKCRQARSKLSSILKSSE